MISHKCLFSRNLCSTAPAFINIEQTHCHQSIVIRSYKISVLEILKKSFFLNACIRAAISILAFWSFLTPKGRTYEKYLEWTKKYLQIFLRFFLRNFGFFRKSSNPKIQLLHKKNLKKFYTFFISILYFISFK